MPQVRGHEWETQKDVVVGPPAGSRGGLYHGSSLDKSTADHLVPRPPRQSSASRLVRKVLTVVGHPVSRMRVFQVADGVFVIVAINFRAAIGELALYRNVILDSNAIEIQSPWAGSISNRYLGF